MYNWKDLAKGFLAFSAMMTVLGALMVLNGLHYAGVI